MDETFREEVALYVESADESLKVAQLNLENDFYAAAINRAYYAIFYAANAVLATQNLARSKHSGVLAVFRQYFIKTEVLPTELSVIYGQVMEDRQEGDYEIMTAASKDDAAYDLHQAQYFVEQVKTWLRKENWL
ncbi:MAG: HEPN domain-containing protein [Anaerolineales bacterium]